jgi:hypothetical protein
MLCSLLLSAEHARQNMPQANVYVLLLARWLFPVLAGLNAVLRWNNQVSLAPLEQTQCV